MHSEANQPTERQNNLNSPPAGEPEGSEPGASPQRQSPAAAAEFDQEPKRTENAQTAENQTGPASADSPQGPRRAVGPIPALRVQIGSLANPDIAREAKPKPNLQGTPYSRPANPGAASPTPANKGEKKPIADAPTKPQPATAREAEESNEETKPRVDLEQVRAKLREEPAPPAPRKFPPPNIRKQLPPELEREFAEAMGDVSLEAILETGTTAGQELEPESKVTARVVSLHRDNIFVDLGGQKQGVLSTASYETPPAIGEQIEVVVVRFNAEDGLYEVSPPGAAVEVGDWSEVAEGMIVQAVVTGHNKGGLECIVNNIRGFMPISQIAVYRVENLEDFVGQSFAVLVTEANPERRNLVLSRRAVLEREAAEAKEKLLAELAPGQLREGVVRSLQNFGAFVDLGGVDGLIHISQLSWDRVAHPSDVLSLGQKVQVRIEKIDPKTGKIGLSYRDLAENPWKSVATKYHVGMRATGTVSKLTEFGAFVKLEPGVEGLVHISELSHKRVWRASDVVSEGQAVDVKILSIDVDAQRIGLSLKALEARPEPKASSEPEVDEAPLPEAPTLKKHTGPLKGGLGGPSGGEKFGLKW